MEKKYNTPTPNPLGTVRSPRPVYHRARTTTVSLIEEKRIQRAEAHALEAQEHEKKLNAIAIVTIFMVAMAVAWAVGYRTGMLSYVALYM